MYVCIHIYIYMAVSHLLSNKKNSKDRQHTNFGKYMHGCKRAERAKRAERRARLDCNAHKTCQNLHITHAKICT